MQVIRPISQVLAGRTIIRRRIHPLPSVGCSYWTRRAFATRPHTGDQDIQDDDLFGESSSSSRPASLSENSPAEAILEEATQDVELGDEPDAGVSGKEQLLHRPKLPGSIKRLNRILSRQRKVEIPESELEEKFVRGRGPGGQAINKTNSSVSLTHIPTGIRIQSQPTRSREENRKVARRILGERLEVLRTTGQLPGYDVPGIVIELPQDVGLINKSKKAVQKEEEKVMSGTYTKQEIKNEKERRRKLNRAKKAKKKYGKKGEEGEESGEEDVNSMTNDVRDTPSIQNTENAKTNTRV